MNATTRLLTKGLMSLMLATVVVAGGIAVAHSIAAAQLEQGTISGMAIKSTANVEAQPMLTAMMSYDVVSANEEAIYVREENYLDLEAEGALNNAVVQTQAEEELRSGMWQELFPELYQRELMS